MLDQYYNKYPDAKSEIIIPLVLNHHEHFDGSGYPKGIKGEAIPPVARLLTIIDSFTAGVESRSYSSRETIEESLEYLYNHVKEFDPNYLNMVIDFINSGALDDVSWILQ